MPSGTLIPFLVGLGSLINAFRQKRAPFFFLGRFIFLFLVSVYKVPC